MILSPFGELAAAFHHCDRQLMLFAPQSSCTPRLTHRSQSSRKPKLPRPTGSRSSSSTLRSHATDMSQSTSRRGLRRGTAWLGLRSSSWWARWTSSEWVASSCTESDADDYRDRCILLPNDPVATGQMLPPPPPGTRLPDLKLWGLTLGFVASRPLSVYQRSVLTPFALRSMTLDLLAHMTPKSAPEDLSTYPYAVAALDTPLTGREGASTTAELAPFAPSEASIFPRFVRPFSRSRTHLAHPFASRSRTPTSISSSGSSHSATAASFVTPPTPQPVHDHPTLPLLLDRKSIGQG